jgi:hypothetical protein
MKAGVFVSALVLFVAGRVQASDVYSRGYIISNTNDTIECKIVIPIEFGRFNRQSCFFKVTVVDSLGNKKKYFPKDILGYAFIYEGKAYTYVSKQTDEDGKRMFVWPMNLGKRINGYYYYYYNSSDNYKGSMGYDAEVYVLEDPLTKETVSITPGGSLTNSYKAQLRKFYENDKQMLALIVQDVKTFHDIPRFVQDANNHPD